MLYVVPWAQAERSGSADGVGRLVTNAQVGPTTDSGSGATERRARPSGKRSESRSRAKIWKRDEREKGTRTANGRGGFGRQRCACRSTDSAAVATIACSSRSRIKCPCVRRERHVESPLFVSPDLRFRKTAVPDQTPFPIRWKIWAVASRQSFTSSGNARRQTICRNVRWRADRTRHFDNGSKVGYKLNML